MNTGCFSLNDVAAAFLIGFLAKAVFDVVVHLLFEGKSA